MSNDRGSLITDELRAALGTEFAPVTNCDVVTTSELRRFIQATMDDSRIYYDEAYAQELKYGGIVAPGSYPITNASRRAPGTPDPLIPGEARSDVEDEPAPSQRIPWPPDLQVFHAYSDLEVYQLAKPGDQISMRRRVADAYEKTGRSGRLLFVVTENVFTNQNGDVLCTERYVDVGVQ